MLAVKSHPGMGLIASNIAFEYEIALSALRTSR
jgi:hypothetical protein